MACSPVTCRRPDCKVGAFFEATAIWYSDGMERFARVVLGYHGCDDRVATALLDGTLPVSRWQPSQNDFDWLGHGIYFWEHSPKRAFRWAQDRATRHGGTPGVVGAVIQLGDSFDLLNEEITGYLADAYALLHADFAMTHRTLPTNTGPRGKVRRLDCLVINDCLNRYQQQGVAYDTVRGAFEEGAPVYPGAGFARETHIQVAVRNLACILGVFRPNF